MRILICVAAALAAWPAVAAAQPAATTTTTFPLLPFPAELRPGKGSFLLSHATVAAAAGDPGAAAAAARLQALLAQGGGARLPSARAGAATIRFVRDPAVAGAEAYSLAVTPEAVVVRASGDAGLFYGAETLWQLMAAAGPGGRVPAVTISDRPAFAWRGVMLDSARHMQPVAWIETLIDRMAADKLNTFHWHLTDDQGWRLPVPGYPRLTTIGAYRTPAGAEARDAQGRPARYGGFYTEAEIRAVVAYAAQRHVTVVPEVDMPGHMTAAIAAYPALGSTPNPPHEPTNEYGILSNLLNPDEPTFRFVDAVLDQLMRLFPSRYIHVGGDEAIKDQWRANSTIQAKIRALGLKDEDALQGWFTARAGAYLAAHGRQLVGWDEILTGGVPADATVMSWRGIDGAIAAAKAGHDTVLSPAPVLYLDNRQSDAADEPPGRGELVDWKRLYAFDPAPPALTADQRRHILGLQVNLWTERMRTTAQADRMIWPRAAVLAELGWSPPASRDWTGFSGRLLADAGRWRALGWGYDETPLAPAAEVAAEAATITQPAGLGVLRYTRDGTEPTPRSPAVEGPIAIGHGLTIGARAFLGGEPAGPFRRFALSPADALTRVSAQLQLCGQAIPLRLEDDAPTDGARRIFWADVMHPCWIWKDAPLTGVARIAAEVGQVPFNLSIGADRDKIVFDRPETAAGELLVRRDGCAGALLARIPLGSAAAGPGVTAITGAIPATGGTHDLCITFAQTGPDSLWLLDRLTLIPAPAS